MFIGSNGMWHYWVQRMFFSGRPFLRGGNRNSLWFCFNYRESIIDATTTLKADSQSSSAYNSRNRRKRQSTNHISSLYSRDMTNKDSKQDNRSRDRKDPKLKEVSNNNTRSRTPDSNRHCALSLFSLFLSIVQRRQISFRFFRTVFFHWEYIIYHYT